MDGSHIAFNGLWDCGHAKNEEIVIPFPTVDAAGIGSSINGTRGSYYGMGTLLKHRTCDGNCSYESSCETTRCPNASPAMRSGRN
jgi:hypothetical protein